MKLLIIFIYIVTAKSEKCLEEFKIPQNCFEIEEILDYVEVAKKLEKSNSEYLDLLTEAGFVVDETEPGVDLFFSPELTEETKKYQANGKSIINFLEIAHHHVKKDHGLNGEEVLYCINQLKLRGDEIGICEKQNKQLECPHKMSFQPLDGKCVNQKEMLKGAENTPYGRFMKNSYKDHIHEIRKSFNDKALPSPRIISKGLRTLYEPIHFTPKENLNNDFLLFYMKIVIFDIAKTLKAQTFDANFGFECCDGNSKLSSKFYNQDCLPIEIPRDDLVFRGQTCMNYIRSMVTHDECEISEAKILNTVSHYLDMDFIYDLENVKSALKNNAKFDESDIRNLILSGDERAVMLPQLYSIMVIWIKFHNFVADKFSEIHKLDTDTLFYETRRFVIAFYQHIWYNEVLPSVLSQDTLVEYQLVSSKPCYDPQIDPSISSEFVASAGRFLHTFIQDFYEIEFINGTKSKIPLRKLLYHNLDDMSFMGIIKNLFNSSWNTETIGNDISNYLFSTHGPGLDLRALDIQAERDFGVATYCNALKFLNMTGKCVKSFRDFNKFMSKESVDFLKYAFEHPCDVDLGAGASLHSTGEFGTISEVFDRIFGMQFSNTKCGDPWFYTNSLSEDQVKFFSHLSFSDILCAIEPELSIQPFAFLTPGENNRVGPCGSHIYLSEWQILSQPQNKNQEDDFLEFTNE